MNKNQWRWRGIVFPGIQNLPNFAAEANGFFAKRRLAIETTFTKSSQPQRDGWAHEEYDMAHSPCAYSSTRAMPGAKMMSSSTRNITTA